MSAFHVLNWIGGHFEVNLLISAPFLPCVLAGIAEQRQGVQAGFLLPKTKPDAALPKPAPLGVWSVAGYLV